MSTNVGELLAGRYRLAERLGSGGFGDTWKASDELLGVEVALKVFWERDVSLKERYLREARALARYAGDPGIVGIRDLVETDECVMLVMEHLDGCDLQEHLAQRGRISLDETVRLLQPIAAAVARMHADGLLHRDISPDNIRVLPDGTARLFDFGSVGGSAATSTITVKPGYAPPEQYATPDQQGPWTDVYALAATMYQCIVGLTPMDSLQRTFHDELMRPSQAGAAVSAAVDAALMEALEPDYRKRTQTVDAFMAAIGAGMAHGDAPSTLDAGMSDSALVSAAPAGGSVPEAPAKPMAPEAPAKAEKPRRPRSKGGKVKFAIIALAVLAVAVVGVFGIRTFMVGGGDGGTKYRTGASHTSFIREETISSATLDVIAADEETNILDISRCAIDDEAIRRISEIDHLAGVQLTECTGFTTLEPLQKSDSVTKLSINRFDDFDCGTMLPAEAPAMTFFQMRNMRIKNAGGLLERFPALEQLSLCKLEGLGGVSALANMPNLEEVELVGIDLSGKRSEALASHAKLRSVEAPGAGIDSMGWAATCPELQTLALDGNKIDDISALAACGKLDHVVLNGNAIADISALATSSGTLFDLAIAGNKVKDLSALAKADRLYTLEAGGNGITDISPLAGCVNLAYVDLSDNDIADASPLAGCENMRRLGLARNRISNLDFCANFIKLAELNAAFNRITDIDKLANCTSAERVCLQDNQITDVSAFGNGFVALELLNLANNKVKSLEPLGECGLLCRLGIYNNEITSLEGLENKPNLWIVLADNNQISDISALSSSTQHLEYVDLGHNEVSDISALANMFSANQTPGKFGIHGGGVAVLLDCNKVERVDSLPVRDDYRVLALHGNPVGDVAHLAQDDVKWSSLYLPYVEGADYSAFNAYLNVDMNFVDVPLDKRAEVLRASLKAVDPDFLTEEEADAELLAYRKELYEQVSGEKEATTDGSDGAEEADGLGDGVESGRDGAADSSSAPSPDAGKSGGSDGR